MSVSALQEPQLSGLGSYRVLVDINWRIRSDGRSWWPGIGIEEEVGGESM